ncbi:MAG: DNA repair protein RecO [Actinomycetes bacterium]
MAGLYRDEGVVLRTVKLGEADRIVTMFTAEHGRIRAVAKGVRRSGSRFGARLEPPSNVAVQCYRGRDLDVVTQVECIDVFRSIREDYTNLTRAAAILEVVDQLTPDREPNPALHRMLVGALRTLDATPSPVITPAFFWKALSLEGLRPLLTACVRCGTSASEYPAIDLAEGGVLCAACGRVGGTRITPEGLALLELLVSGGLHRAMAEPPAPEAIAEVERLGIAALEHHSERRLRTAALL